MKLNHTLLPMINYHKAKTLIWDPRDVDCTQDQSDWAALTGRGAISFCAPIHHYGP